MRREKVLVAVFLLTVALVALGCAKTETAAVSGEVTDEEIDNIVRRSYQYVAMYNVNSKEANRIAALTDTNGWNLCVADTELKDHNFKLIARPNNDTLYASCMLDLRNEPIVIEYPAFDSDYAVLETSAYDHYCDIPLSTTFGDFREPTAVLYYTERTKGYSGEAIEGVDTTMELSGDFAIAFLRVISPPCRGSRRRPCPNTRARRLNRRLRSTSLLPAPISRSSKTAFSK
jgi:hypothetical protein